MMSPEYMHQLAVEAAERSREESTEPMTFGCLGHDGIRAHLRSIPFLGKNDDKTPFVPEGWVRVDAPDVPRLMGVEDGYLFVDASGLGSPGEPALTVGEFANYAYDHKDLGYGIVEAGQFQVVIATYARKQ